MQQVDKSINMQNVDSSVQIPDNLENFFSFFSLLDHQIYRSYNPYLKELFFQCKQYNLQKIIDHLCLHFLQFQFSLNRLFLNEI